MKEQENVKQLMCLYMYIMIFIRFNGVSQHHNNNEIIVMEG